MILEVEFKELLVEEIMRVFGFGVGKVESVVDVSFFLGFGCWRSQGPGERLAAISIVIVESVQTAVPSLLSIQVGSTGSSSIPSSLVNIVSANLNRSSWVHTMITESHLTAKVNLAFAASLESGGVWCPPRGGEG